MTRRCVRCDRHVPVLPTMTHLLCAHICDRILADQPWTCREGPRPIGITGGVYGIEIEKVDLTSFRQRVWDDESAWDLEDR